MRKLIAIVILLWAFQNTLWSQNHRMYVSLTYQSADLGMTGFYPAVEYLYTGFKYDVGVSFQYFKNYYEVYDVVNPYTGIRHLRQHEYFRWAVKPRFLFPLLGNNKIKLSMQFGPFVEYLRTVIYQYSGYSIDPRTGEFTDITGYAEPYKGFFYGVYAGFRLDFAYKKWVGKINMELDTDKPDFPVVLIGVGLGRRF